MLNNYFIQRINNSFSKVAEWSINHRLTVFIVCIVLCIAAAASTVTLDFYFHHFSFFPDDSPATDYYMEFTEEYGNDEFIYILYTADPGIFSLDILKKTKELVEDIKEAPYVKKVHSVVNVEFMEGSPEGELKISGLMNRFPASQPEADQLKRKLLDKPLYVNTYISKDGKYAALFCEIEDIPEDDIFYQKKIGLGIKKILKDQRYRDFKFYIAGTPIVASALHEQYEENTPKFSAITFILITFLLIFLFRQLKGLLGPFVIICVTLLLSLGFMAVFNLPVTLLFAMVPSVLMALGVAYAVHMVSEYQIHLHAGKNNRDSIIEAVKLLGFPCLFTSVTTAIGFSSLYLSPVKVIRVFGLIFAFGALAAFACSFTVLLALLSVAGKKSENKFKGVKIKKNHGYLEKALLGIANFNIRYYKQVLIVSLLITITLIYGMTKVEVNTSTLSVFGDKLPIFHNYKFIDKIMGGTGNFEVLLQSNETEGVKTLRFVQILEMIQDFAKSKNYIVKKSVSITDIIKDVNCSMHNNDKAFYKLPSSDEEVAQFLLLYEFSGGEELEKLVSADLATARLTIYTKSTDSNVNSQFHKEMVSFIESVKPADYDYIITGISYLSVEVYRCMTEIMIKSLSLALVAISIMMILVFRSFKIGLLSMVANIFPIFFAIGFLGLSGIWLSSLTSIVGCVVIGLAVDDTIHFFSRYKIEFDRLGNYPKALQATMTGVGRALAITTIILVTAFAAFITSKMTSFTVSGMLTSLCFLVALLADFFIAPVLILIFKPFGKEFDK